MSRPHNTEPLANAALASALKRRNPDWDDGTVHAERTQVIYQAGPGSGAGRRPDILIAAPDCQPVIVETEFAPARTVERDALARLGASMRGSSEEVEGVLSVVLPESLKTADLQTIEGAAFRYAAHYLDAEGVGTRWPPRLEWLEGGVDDLADAIEYLSLSERKLARGTEALELVVRQASGRLAHWVPEPALARIAKRLHQEAGEQTERMAAAIFVSAFVFHMAVEGQGRVPPVLSRRPIHKPELVALWREILEVNYWPIFSIALELLMELPTRCVPRVMDRIAEAVPDLVQVGATTYHELAGRMFQTLIADRKYLATFYTLPASACLLAELAVERLGLNWSDRDGLAGLRIADFACGTGALLSAAQRAVYRRIRRAGGDDKELHRVLMEHVLTGLDIMPAATHLTCSMLSSAHPSLTYGKSLIHTMPYGIDGGATHIGALDLLAAEHAYSLFATGETLGGREAESSGQHAVRVLDESFDLVIMNPPFTRPTNHEGGHAGIPVPSFAGFGTSHEEQEAMGRKLRKGRGPFGSGNAGLASNFMDLGHCKLRAGGVLAMVLPFAFVRGKAWQGAREALQAHYSDIHVTSIAATGSTERAFSADTGMAECLLVATKRSVDRSRTEYTNLAARPASLLEAAQQAKEARGAAVAGGILEGGVAGVQSSSVIRAVRELEAGQLRLPRQAQALELPVVTLGSVAARGLVHRDINGDFTSHDGTGQARGPFVVRGIAAGEVPTYPMLWAHAAGRERRLVVRPDSCGEPRPNDEERAIERWNAAASCLHVSLDFQLNSQSLAMCLTPEKCLGGRAWPNVMPHEPHYEIPLLLWANSTLGLLLFWWHGTRQQQGRACITVTKLPDLPVLDPRTLRAGQLERCRALFEQCRERDFLPANEAYRDATRQALDRELLFGSDSVLGLDPVLEEGLGVLREQWCAEPSVHGGKHTRILYE